MDTEEQAKVNFIKDISFLGPAMHLSVEIQSSGEQAKGNKGLYYKQWRQRDLTGIMKRG